MPSATDGIVYDSVAASVIYCQMLKYFCRPSFVSSVVSSFYRAFSEFSTLTLDIASY